MRLYHGTHGANVPKILERGLRPRGPRKSVWARGAFKAAGDLASRDDAVYLTDTYALWFALQALAIRKGRGLAAIIEVDVDRLNPFDLIPDEDAIQQALRLSEPSQFEKLQTDKGAGFCRAHTHLLRGHCKASLDALGTCAHLGAIPPSAITRFALVDPRKAVTLCKQVSDMLPWLSTWQHAMLAQEYRALTEWLFGDADLRACRLFREPPSTERAGITITRPRYSA